MSVAAFAAGGRGGGRWRWLAALVAVFLGGPALEAAAPAPEVGRPFVRVYAPAESGIEDDVWCATQDATGIMFFGTRGAVIEFDGETWRRLAVPTEGRVFGLASAAGGDVWVLAEAEVGRFVVTPTGVRVYESFTERVRERMHSSPGRPAGASQRPGALLTAGGQLAAAGFNVWLSLPGALLRWSGSEFAVFASPDGRALELFDLGSRGVLAHATNQGVLRLGDGAPEPVEGGVHSVDALAWLSPIDDDRWLVAQRDGVVSVVDSGGAQRLALVGGPLERVVSGAALRDGGYAFLLAHGGVAVLDAALRLRYQAGTEAGIPLERVHALHVDRAEGIWICTGRGVIRIEHRLPVTIFDASNGLEASAANPSPARMVALRPPGVPRQPEAMSPRRRDLATGIERHEGRVLVELANGGALAYDYERGRFAAAAEFAGARALAASPAGVIVNDASGVWLNAGEGPGERERHGSYLAGAPVSLDDDRFSYATDTHLVQVERAGGSWRSTAVPHGLSGAFVNAAAETPETWWISGPKSLVRARLVDGRIEQVETFTAEDGLAPETVASFARRGDDWLALTHGGLRRFDPATRRFVAFDGLGAEFADGSRFVRALVVDPAGRTWMIVLRERRDSDSAQVISIDRDGQRHELPRDVRLRLGRIMHVALDTGAAEGAVLWLIGYDTLGRLDLSHWPMAEAGEPFPVNLRSARFAEDDALPLSGEKQTFTQGARSLRFNYAAAHFPLSGRVEYQAWLEGLEPPPAEWQASATREFTHLPVGNYTLQVRARHNGVTGQAQASAFSVVPPWWRTAPAWAAWILMAGGAVFGVVRWRVVRLRRRNEVLENVVATRTAALTASEEQLRATRDAAEEANRAKSVFLAHMSHELRTPLNGILGYTQILRRDPALSDAHRERLNVVVESGEHLLGLINEVLDLARIEAGKMELRATDVSLSRLARGVADVVRPRCEEKGLAFEVVLAPGLPRVVRTDELKLRQALLNLLGNAAKFTVRGRVTFGVAPAADGRVRFSVDDTGPGIAPDRIARLFTPFDTTSPTTAQGTGLGLVLSQRMVELLGGRIQVDSTPARGSRFWFDLPLPDAGSAEPFATLASARAIVGYRGARRRLLVVDDEATNRSVLRELLAPLGFAISEASDGAAALAAARATAPDAILLDLRFMDGPQGFAVARALREEAAFAAMKIVAVSASVFETDRHEALAAGCDAFLAKPFQEEQLLAVLGTVLGIEWDHAAPPASAAEVKSEPLPELVRAALFELSQRGDVLHLRAKLAELAANPVHAAFARQLDQLAASFQMKRLREILSEGA